MRLTETTYNKVTDSDIPYTYFLERENEPIKIPMLGNLKFPASAGLFIYPKNKKLSQTDIEDSDKSLDKAIEKFVTMYLFFIPKEFVSHSIEVINKNLDESLNGNDSSIFNNVIDTTCVLGLKKVSKGMLLMVSIKSDSFVLPNYNFFGSNIPLVRVNDLKDSDENCILYEVVPNFDVTKKFWKNFKNSVLYPDFTKFCKKQYKAN
jgi:hypothetical protein